MAQTKRGKLIVFEGLDRAGKSSQCERLISHLRSHGHRVEGMRFPDRTTPIGQMISSYLAGDTQTEDHVIHLLFTANRWEKAEVIKRHIEQGTTVLVDRYYYSGCVYTAAKQIPGLDLGWCRRAEVGLPRPDVCVFLDISAEKAAERGGYGLERYEKREMQDRVRALFSELREHDDERDDIKVVDGGQSIDEVAEAIQRIVGEAMEVVDEKGDLLRIVRSW